MNYYGASGGSMAGFNYKAVIDGEPGQAAFISEFDVRKAAGKDESVCYAFAWAALQKLGYAQGADGVWRKPDQESVLQKISKFLKDLKHPAVSSDLGLVETMQKLMQDEADAAGGNAGAFTFDVAISKIDNDKQIVWGWASVIEENGQPVMDRQNDFIEPDELVKAAHGFVTKSRTAKAMHEGEQTGEVVESMVFTKELQAALGVDLKKVGWFIGMKVNSADVWKRVKSKELTTFSIGGKGRRHEKV